jgi:adenylate cyclase
VKPLAFLRHGVNRSWLAALACWLAFPLLLLLPAAQRLDNAWGDQLVRWRAQSRPGDPSIVLIDIDEWSMQAMASDVGKWPWPRSVHAGLLEPLLAEKPRAVVFDIFFSDKDILRPDDDAWFGEILAAASNVYLAALQLGDAAVPTLLASYPAGAGLEPGPAARADARGSLLLPFAIPATAWRIGSVNFTPDPDGIGRGYDVYREIQGWRWSSLPARVARDLGATLPDAPTYRIDFPAGGTRPYTRLLYREVYEHFVQGKKSLPEGFFKDRIVLIGNSASGLQDTKPTPISSAYPGVVMVGVVIDNLLHGAALHIMPFPVAWLVLGLLLAAMAETARRGQMLIAITIGAGGATALAAGSAALAIGAAGITPWPVPALLIAIFMGTLALIQYRERQAELARTVRTFERFMDPEIVRHLLHDEDATALLSSRTCEITVLFSDIRGFTRLSEQRSAVEVVRLLDDYFSRQVAVIFRHGGTLDKFIGDAVMAFWGAPLANPAQHRAAVACALEMRQEMERFRRDYGFTDFDIGVGIHTGQAVVGMIGCEQRYDFTAIGDTVNLASRIEGLTKDRAPILVSAATRAGCGAEIHFRPQGTAQVKGREEAVELFEPIGGDGHDDRQTT